ncbi:MAG: chemotaxis protein CheW [Anaerolineae bacterium]|nr:MAG: chemotaxis protein CheW [Anaerolineae bacterium]
MSEPYILFQLAGATYAVPSAQVLQVAMIENITRLPNAPDFVDGVVHLRGRIVPVVNLRRRFNLPPKDYDLQSRLIVIEQEGRVVAMAVDTARDFVTLDSDALQPTPDLVGDAPRKYLRGVFAREDGLILVLDLHKVLNPEERAALAEAAPKE